MTVIEEIRDKYSARPIDGDYDAHTSAALAEVQDLITRIEIVCEPHKETMLAAMILGIINGTDYRGDK